MTVELFNEFQIQHASVLELKFDEQFDPPFSSFPRKRESELFGKPGFRLALIASLAGMTVELFNEF
jgi:hypothetical protein